MKEEEKLNKMQVDTNNIELKYEGHDQKFGKDDDYLMHPSLF